jgi:Dyp-type peroxidase family
LSRCRGWSQTVTILFFFFYTYLCNTFRIGSFGFHDGISQPGVKGFTALNNGPKPVSPRVFLFGNDTDPRTSVLAKDGSFLAFRKWNQLVPKFNLFLKQNGANLDGMTPEEGANFLGARLIGRWMSGAPIDMTPLKDDPILAKDPEQNNNFHYSFTNPDDQTDQTRCPFATHIRKAFPRQDLEKIRAGIIDKNRIIRQGCPFGPEVTDEENYESKTIHERGLGFVSYQSVLSNGFSFIQKCESFSSIPLLSSS